MASTSTVAPWCGLSTRRGARWCSAATCANTLAKVVGQSCNRSTGELQAAVGRAARSFTDCSERLPSSCKGTPPMLQAPTTGAATGQQGSCKPPPVELQEASPVAPSAYNRATRGAADASNAYHRSCNRSIGELQAGGGGAARSVVDCSERLPPELQGELRRCVERLPPELQPVNGEAASRRRRSCKERRSLL